MSAVLEQFTKEDIEWKKEDFKDQFWRLNNLYKIRDKEGAVVRFILNAAQVKMYWEQWFLNVILKARQLGFSTLIDILILDTCIFNKNVKAGIIAHHTDDANAIFDDKIKFPYENMDEVLRRAISATTDRAGEIVFSNGSSIRVSTSFRSGTLQILHVSELGKIAAKYPEKAKEIRTGAFEAVAAGQKIFVESTAEGREGEFYDMVTKAKNLQDSCRELTKLDFKFHFFPWHDNPGYRIDPQNVIFTQEDVNYFHQLEARNIFLDDEQKAWWIKKHEILQEEIYREHPSYPEEAFKASVEGAYYGTIITKLRRQGRIGKVPHDPLYEVNTAWDLGMFDSMSIWFFQQIAREIRVINYYENSGEGLPFYINYLKKEFPEYSYGQHFWPHDGTVRELGTGKARIDTATSLGLVPIIIVARPKNNEQLHNQIDDTRAFLSMSYIDEEHCDRGIKGLENYRKAWDDKLGTFKKKPLGNWASHPADAMRTGAVGFVTKPSRQSGDLIPDHVADY